MVPKDGSDDPDVGESSDHRDPAARHSVLRNARWLAISQGVSWTLALVLTAVQPRVLGAEGVGQLRVANSLWTVAGVFIAFGTGSIITLGLARGEKFGDKLRAVMGLQVIIYCISAAAVLLFSALAGYKGQTMALILIGGGSPLLMVFGDNARAAFYGLERMSFPAKVDLTMKFGLVVCSLVVLAAGGRVVALALVIMLLGALYGVVMLVGLRRAGFSVIPSRAGIGGVAKLALPFVIVQATVVAYRQSDTLILSKLSGQIEVGWYAVSETLLGSLLVIPTITLTAVYPTLARISSEQPDAALRLLRRGVRILFLVTTPIGLGMVVVSEQVAPLLFGKAFERSGSVLGTMGLVMIIMVPSLLLANYAAAINRASRWTLITLAAIAFSIPLYAVFIPWTSRRYDNGAFGAAIVFAATELLILVLAVRFVAPKLFDRRLTVGSARVALAGVLMLAATWPLRDRFLLLPIAVGAATYCVAVALLRAVDKEERQVIRELGARLRNVARRR